MTLTDYLGHNLSPEESLIDKANNLVKRAYLKKDFFAATMDTKQLMTLCHNLGQIEALTLPTVGLNHHAMRALEQLISDTAAIMAENE